MKSREEMNIFFFSICLAADINCVSEVGSRQHLRSASPTDLAVLCFWRATHGGRAFHVAVGRIWNKQPSPVTSSSSLTTFIYNASQPIPWLNFQNSTRSLRRFFSICPLNMTTFVFQIIRNKQM